MKKTILLSICLLLGAWTLSAQQTIYVIDNETVEHFDGSQLKGKTIKDYKITTQGSGRKAITVHAITTAPPTRFKGFAVPNFRADSLFAGKDIKIITQGAPKKIVYIIDGERSEDSAPLRKISSYDIESISIIKDGSPEQLKYGEDVSVIKITTKKGRGKE
ncbi:MAG: hypothetical protein J6M23_04725 [Bacteroidales bacterium]|nr:hypothetical protein [Bacteroidales bacterium]